MALSCQSSEPCLCASVLYLNSFCASIRNICPKVSEKPETGHFFGLGTLRIFPCKLMAIASLFCTISAYESLHRNAVLSDSRETCSRTRFFFFFFCRKGIVNISMSNKNKGQLGFDALKWLNWSRLPNTFKPHWYRSLSPQLRLHITNIIHACLLCHKTAVED